MEVGFGAANVAPVAGGFEAVELLAAGEKLGEEVAGEVVAGVCGNLLEDAWGEDVDSGVDAVSKDLVPGGFFDEAFDAAVAVGHHEAVF